MNLQATIRLCSHDLANCFGLLGRDFLDVRADIRGNQKGIKLYLLLCMIYT